jgi:hypothetical protein
VTGDHFFQVPDSDEAENVEEKIFSVK